jgi:glutathione synthase/RimK-type ligase-like ATP-grasp enzyme
MQSEPVSAGRWRYLVLALGVWLEHIPGTVINRPGSYSDNSAKPLHEYTLSQYGLPVPPSFTSSDAARLAAFASEGPTVVKTVSGVRARCRFVKAEEFQDFHPAQGPVHLQRYVAGADIRAHIVGDAVYAELIRSEGVDYRSSDQPCEFSSYQLPDSLTALLVQATRAFGLMFAGWDLKLTEDGQYYCLEANPMPGYNGYDRRLKGQITEALLKQLCQ